MTVGIFNFLELGGRLTDAAGRTAADLSASFKVTSAPLDQGQAALAGVGFWHAGLIGG